MPWTPIRVQRVLVIQSPRLDPVDAHGVAFEFDDSRRDYGERRIIAYGAVAGRILVCVYTWRGTADDPLRWIISLRRANRGESHAYRTVFPQ